MHGSFAPLLPTRKLLGCRQDQARYAANRARLSAHFYRPTPYNNACRLVALF